MSAEFTPKCKADSKSSSYHYYACGKPAIAIGVGGWGGATKLTPLCKKHVGIEKRRTYKDFREVRDITAEDLVTLAAEAATAAIVAKEERERKAIEQAARTKAAQERAAAEAAKVVAWKRADKDGELDWEASRAAREADPEADMVLGPSIPRWIGQPAGGFGSFEIVFDQRPGFPLTMDIRHSSNLTVNEAEALRDMLNAAIDLARGGLYPNK
jgi:hypothetical protein